MRTSVPFSLVLAVVLASCGDATTNPAAAQSSASGGKTFVEGKDYTIMERVRFMVLDTGAQSLKSWKQHTRNVADDFLKAFGAESKTVPAITAIIVGADADNTSDNSLGYVADLSLLP